MADVTQVDSADIQVPIETGVVSTTPFPYYSGVPGGGGVIRNWAAKVYNGYLYVVAGTESAATTNYFAGGVVYRINLDNLAEKWERVTGPYFTTSESYKVSNCRFCFSPDGRYLFALFPTFNNSFGNGSYTTAGCNRTAVLDLNNPGVGFLDSAIANYPNTDIMPVDIGGYSSSYMDHYGACAAVCTHDAIYVFGGRQSSGYYSNGMVKLLRAGMSNGAWSASTSCPLAHGYTCSVYDSVNNCIYLAGGHKTTTWTSSSYESTEIIKYDCTTTQWTRNALPPLPYVHYHRFSHLVGRKWYFIGDTSAKSFYIDLDNISAGWIFIEPFSPRDCQIATWDQARNRLLALCPSASNGVQVLPLKPDQTPDGSWTYLNAAGQGSIQSPINPTIDITLVISSRSLDVLQPGATDVSFNISTSGYRISSHTATYINPVTITIQSAGTGASGIAGVGTTDCVFPILSESVETPPPSEIAFTIQSAATGSALVQESQTGTVDIPVVVTTYGQAATGVIGTASILAIDKWYFGGAIAATNIIGMGECDVTVDVGMLYESQNGAIGATGSGAATVLFSLARAFGAMSESHGGAVIVPPATVDGWTVNLATGGHTQFTNWQFNSLFELNGQRYACNDTGLFRLTGNRDGDAVIDGCVISGVTDFGTMKLKYINSAYVHLRTDGDVAFRMVADEQRNRSGYHISFDGRQGIHRRRRKLAKGIKGTVWQAEMRNVDGADMEVAKVELLLAKSKRAIG